MSFFFCLAVAARERDWAVYVGLYEVITKRKDNAYKWGKRQRETETGKESDHED